VLPDGTYFFVPKMLILVYFRGAWNGKSGKIVWPLGIFYRNLVDLMALWHILW
jgi:hypothetical protein